VWGFACNNSSGKDTGQGQVSKFSYFYDSFLSPTDRRNTVYENDREFIAALCSFFTTRERGDKKGSINGRGRKMNGGKMGNGKNWGTEIFPGKTPQFACMT